MSKEKVILAYSGGLDTSVAITWLKKDYDVIAVCMDVGEGKDLEFIHDKALKVGAVKSYVIDVKEEFANDYVLVALQAHTYYEQKYPLVSALSRPLISKKLVEIAHQTGATTIAHGCTGKGNDQVRFEVSIAALDPNLKVVAPVREWKWSREEEIQYAKENGVPVSKIMLYQFCQFSHQIKVVICKNVGTMIVLKNRVMTLWITWFCQEEVTLTRLFIIDMREVIVVL